MTLQKIYEGKIVGGGGIMSLYPVTAENTTH